VSARVRESPWHENRFEGIVPSFFQRSRGPTPTSCLAVALPEAGRLGGRGRLLTVCSIAVLCATICTVSADDSDPVLQALLGPQTRLSAADWSRVKAGRPLAQAVAGADSSIVSAGGVIRLAVNPATFVSHFRRIELIERGATVKQIGRFSARPLVADLQALTLDPDERDALASCRPSDCEWQLPAPAMASLRDAAAAGISVVSTALREFLIDIVQRYHAGGDAALGTYDDRRLPMSVADAFTALSGSRELLARLGPVMSPAFAVGSKPLPRNVSEFFYWSKLDFGLKPTIRVNHVRIVPLTGRADGLRYVILSRQLFANHYFDAGVELRFVVADPAAPASGSFLVYRTETRSRALTGLSGVMLRQLVRMRARGALEHYLTVTKTAVEERARAAK
jgi:hypothetical protein